MITDIPDLKIIETERLFLRELSPRVYKHVFAHLTDDELLKFFGHNSQSELDDERRRYEGGLGTFNKTYFIFHMIEKQGNRTIGVIGYHTWYTQHNRAEIFYMVRDESMRRQGFAREAIRPVLEHGFSEMQLNRVEAFLSPENKPSVRLMEIGGFRREGRLTGHYLINGKYEDSDVYGLLASEYAGNS
jgi:ribosomal-protein-alanine N-acetyltransferase